MSRDSQAREGINACGRLWDAYLIPELWRDPILYDATCSLVSSIANQFADADQPAGYVLAQARLNALVGQLPFLTEKTASSLGHVQ